MSAKKHVQKVRDKTRVIPFKVRFSVERAEKIKKFIADHYENPHGRGPISDLFEKALDSYIEAKEREGARGG